MMGACYDCLVEIGGETRQACMIEVTDGLDITLPTGRVP
jgi:predicted molibdopterin-dependent oxidoreductase YjgC